MCLFDMEGDFSLGNNGCVTVFAVKKGDLPPGSQALLGNEHLRGLSVSLDFVQFRGEVDIGEAIAVGKSFAARFDSLSRSEELSRAPLAPASTSNLWSVLLDVPSMVGLALSLVLALAALLSESVSPTALFSTTIEPRALVVSLVCLSLARVCWLSFEPISARLKADVLPRPTKTIVNAIPVPRRTEVCKFAPSLPPALRTQFKSDNERLAQVFAHHHLGFCFAQAQCAGPPDPRTKPCAPHRFRVYPDRSYYSACVTLTYLVNCVFFCCYNENK